MRDDRREPQVDVSVLVPVLNEEQHIRDSLRAMLDQDFGGRIEILVVDGGSRDRTRALIEAERRSDPRVRLLNNPARRTPSGLNVGLRHARGEYVARMDAHALYPRAYLRRAVARLREGDVQHVSGPQVPYGHGTWSRRVAMALDSPLGVGGASFRRAREEIDVDSGFTGVWRRETLLELGGWDEDWIVNQDGELAARIRKAGGRIVCIPELGARYIPRNNLLSLARQYWRYGKFRVKTSRRHPESMRPSHVLAPGLVLTGILAIVLPRRLARLPRLGWVLYGVTVLAASVRHGRANNASRVDTAGLLAVYTTMHVAWGLGFLSGCFRSGPPLEALSRTAGVDGLLQRLTRGRRGRSG